jgi:DNA repair protein SbcC/Rad50
MIKQLIIHNFQSHADTVLDLDLGVNLITGQSDSGKTAIIRALKWLATNRPLGDGFRSWGSKDATSVSVILDDESLLTHRPSKYILTKNLEVSEWNAVGTGVPETVQQTLNISDLSWQSQMDPPFLLSDSPGEVARTLNEVADLDKIDSTLVNINRMARDNRTQLTAEVQHGRELELQLSEFRNLDDWLARADQLAEQKRKADALDSLAESGMEVLDEYKQVKARISSLRTDFSNIETGLDSLKNVIGELNEQEKQLDDASTLLQQVNCVTARLKQTANALKKQEELWKEKSKDRCPLCGRIG